MGRSGGRALLMGGMLAGGGTLVCLGVALVVLFLPPLKRDMALDKGVKVAAISWVDRGEPAAWESLEYALAASSFGPDVEPRAMCALEPEGEERVVRCAWDERVRVPLFDVVVPLMFQSEARIDAAGDVR